MSITRKLLGIYLGVAFVTGAALAVVGYWLIETNPSVRHVLGLSPIVVADTSSPQAAKVVETNSDVSGRLSELNKRLAEEESARKALDQKFSALEPRLNDYDKLKSDVAGLFSARESNDKSVTVLTQKTNDLEVAANEVTALKRKQASTEQDVSRLMTKVHEIDSLKSEDASIKKAINELAKNMQTFKVDLGRTGEDGKRLSKQFEDLGKAFSQERAELKEVRAYLFVNQNGIRREVNDRDELGTDNPYADDVRQTPPHQRSVVQHPLDARRRVECDRRAHSQHAWEECMSGQGAAAFAGVSREPSIQNARRIYGN